MHGEIAHFWGNKIGKYKLDTACFFFKRTYKTNRERHLSGKLGLTEYNSFNITIHMLFPIQKSMHFDLRIIMKIYIKTEIRNTKCYRMSQC